MKIIDVVRSHQRAHNFFTTMIRLSGSQLHVARVLVGLSRDEVAECAGWGRHSMGGVLEPRDAGADVFASLPRGGYARGSGCALQRRGAQHIIGRLTII